MNTEDRETLLEFPCEFPIKMMGHVSESFQKTAVVLVEKHVGKIDPQAIAVTPSRNGNYLSVTVTIIAESQQQLDNIYQDLTDHEHILVAL
jgi:putative lipoic acid-binding regulatory protein